jgi:hypothetical protein
MYNRPSAPRTIGGVLDDSIRLYRSTFAQVWPLALAAGLVMSVPSLLWDARLRPDGELDPQAALALFKSGSFWLTCILELLVYIIFYNALISALNAAAIGREISIGAALGVGAARLPRSLGAGILLSLLAGAGLILFVVPGLYWIGIFQLVLIPIIAGNSDVRAAFAISRRLIKGHWWRASSITGTMISIVLVVSLLGAFLGAVLTAVLKWSPATGIFMVEAAGVITTVLTLPLYPCALLATYYDLKLRHGIEDEAT